MAPRIAVVGDIILDRYVHGTATRVSPEAPGIVVDVSDVEDRLGGAAAVAWLVAGMGGDVVLYGRIGDDRGSQDTLRLLSSNKLPFVEIGHAEPPVKQRTVCNGHLMPDRLDFGGPRPSEVDVNQCDLQAQVCDCLLIADYNYGTCPPAFVERLISKAVACGVPVLVDPARGATWERYRGATLIKPNRLEAEMLVPSQKGSGLEIIARGLAKSYGVQIAVTRGPSGIIWSDGDRIECSPSPPVQRLDVTGAGDTVLAALGMTWGRMSPAECCRIAAATAARQVEQMGIQQVALAELPATSN